MNITIWGMKSPQSVIVPESVGLIRRTVIREFTRKMNTGCGHYDYVRKVMVHENYRSWKDLYRKGWRCVKVEIAEAE
jgi:hypothetical protein